VEEKRQRKLASVNRELEILRATLNFAMENDWVLKNPFHKKKGIISKVAEVERDRVLSFAEEDRLLAACTDRRAHLRPLIICALDTAMRRGEMFKMVWKDVNFMTGEIHIPQTNSKTEKSRFVGMTPRLVSELQKLWEQSPQDEKGLVLGLTSTVLSKIRKGLNTDTTATQIIWFFQIKLVGPTESIILEGAFISRC